MKRKSLTPRALGKSRSETLYQNLNRGSVTVSKSPTHAIKILRCSLVGDDLTQAALRTAVNGTREGVMILVDCYRSFSQGLRTERNTEYKNWLRMQVCSREHELQDIVTEYWRKNPGLVPEEFRSPRSGS